MICCGFWAEADKSMFAKATTPTWRRWGGPDDLDVNEIGSGIVSGSQPPGNLFLTPNPRTARRDSGWRTMGVGAGAGSGVNGWDQWSRPQSGKILAAGPLTPAQRRNGTPVKGRWGCSQVSYQVSNAFTVVCLSVPLAFKYWALTLISASATAPCLCACPSALAYQSTSPQTCRPIRLSNVKASWEPQARRTPERHPGPAPAMPTGCRSHRGRCRWEWTRFQPYSWSWAMSAMARCDTGWQPAWRWCPPARSPQQP